MEKEWDEELRLKIERRNSLSEALKRMLEELEKKQTRKHKKKNNKQS